MEQRGMQGWLGTKRMGDVMRTRGYIQYGAVHMEFSVQSMEHGLGVTVA